MAYLTPADLKPFASIPDEKALQMIADATATAMLEAPRLVDESDLSDLQKSQVKAVLRGAVLRWHEAGSGVVTQKTLGAAAQTIDQAKRRSMFWESEIEQLQRIVAEDEQGGAFAIDTVPTTGSVHADICALRFGATYCSCGAILTGAGPLYEDV